MRPRDVGEAEKATINKWISQRQFSAICRNSFLHQSYSKYSLSHELPTNMKKEKNIIRIIIRRRRRRKKEKKYWSCIVSSFFLAFCFLSFFAIKYSSKFCIKRIVLSHHVCANALLESWSRWPWKVVLREICKNQNAGMRRLRESVAFRAVASIALAGFDLDLDSY